MVGKAFVIRQVVSVAGAGSPFEVHALKPRCKPYSGSIMGVLLKTPGLADLWFIPVVSEHRRCSCLSQPRATSQGPKRRAEVMRCCAAQRALKSYGVSASKACIFHKNVVPSFLPQPGSKQLLNSVSQSRVASRSLDSPRIAETPWLPLVFPS